MNDNMLKASNQKMVLDQSLSKKGPAALVIMGVTGDLARNKLIPALFRLYRRKALPEQFFLIGFSRRPLNNSDFAKLITDSLERFSATSQELAEFIVRATYIQGNFDNSDSYQNLFTNLVSLSKTTASPLQVLLYVATPPSVYETIFSQLAILEAGATRHLRILIEKPFGHDSRTAAALDRRLGELFTEQQIFRIDHYLAKETVQNIMTFRFANSMFEPIWNREHIERVEIRLLERNDVSNRGNFYHDVGALRDVGQNHLLQMLALVAMEDPGSFSAVPVRAARARLLSDLVKPTTESIGSSVCRGQYRNFVGEPGVPEGSETETYFKIRVGIDNSRWQGVPFFLESGKGVSESLSDIKVFFKSKPVCFAASPSVHCGNVVSFRIQPNEGVSVTFWAKRPGLSTDPEPKTLVVDFAKTNDTSDAYERVLFDAILGDQTLFTSTDEVRAAWQFITSILTLWKDLPLHKYDKGASGPVCSLA